MRHVLQVLLVCMLCSPPGAGAWCGACRRATAARAQSLHANSKTSGVAKASRLQTQQSTQQMSILTQRTSPVQQPQQPQQQPVRRKPGFAHIMRAAKQASLKTAGITTADIDAILRDKRLPKSKAVKLTAAREILTQYVTRVSYARRREAHEFIPGMKVKGRVISIEKRGAFIDIGCVRDAFLGLGDCHPELWVEDVGRFVRIGQDIDVYIKQVGKTPNYRPTVSLFRRDPAPVVSSNRLPVSAFNISGQVKGVVTKATADGAFVDIGAQVDAHLPLRFAKERYEYPELGMFELMPEGTNITAWVARVDAQHNRIQLTTEPTKIGWLYWPTGAITNEVDFVRSSEEHRLKFPPEREQSEDDTFVDEQDVPWTVVSGGPGKTTRAEWSIEDEEAFGDFDGDERSTEVDRYILDDLAEAERGSDKPGERGAGAGRGGEVLYEEDMAVNGLIGGDGEKTLEDFRGTGILSPIMTDEEIARHNRMVDKLNELLYRRT